MEDTKGAAWKERGDLKSTANQLIAFLHQRRDLRWLRGCWRKLAYDLMVLLSGLRPAVLLDYVFASSVDIADLLQRLGEECDEVHSLAFLHTGSCHYLLNKSRLRDLDPDLLVARGWMRFILLKRGKPKVADNEETSYFKNHLARIYSSLVCQFLDTPIECANRPHRADAPGVVPGPSSCPCSCPKRAPSDGRLKLAMNREAFQTGMATPSNSGKSSLDSILTVPVGIAEDAVGCNVGNIFNSEEIPLPAINGFLRFHQGGHQSGVVTGPNHRPNCEELTEGSQFKAWVCIFFKTVVSMQQSWLLGYPVVYAFRSCERDDAARCLSLCELILVRVLLPSKFLAKTYQRLTSGKGRSIRQCGAVDCNVLFSFTVPTGVEGLQNGDIGKALSCLQGHFADRRRGQSSWGELWEETRVETSVQPMQQAAVL